MAGSQGLGPLQLGLVLLAAFCTGLVSPVLASRLSSSSPLSLWLFSLYNVLLSSWLLTTIMELRENSNRHNFFFKKFLKFLINF